MPGGGQGEPNGQKRGSSRSLRRKTAHRPATARCATPAFSQGASHPVQQKGGSLLAAKAPRVGFTPRQGLLATGRQHDRIPGGREEHKSGLTQEGRNQLGLDEPGWSQTWIPKAGMHRGLCGIRARRRQDRGPSRETQAISAQEQGTSCLVRGSSPHSPCHIRLTSGTPALALTTPGPYICLVSGRGVVPEKRSDPPMAALSSSCLLHDFCSRFSQGQLPRRQVPGPTPKARW